MPRATIHPPTPYRIASQADPETRRPAWYLQYRISSGLAADGRTLAIYCDIAGPYRHRTGAVRAWERDTARDINHSDIITP